MTPSEGKLPCSESQLQDWRQEQYRIASLVKIETDPKDESDCPNDRFKVLNLHPRPTELYGGVDVSFPDNENNQSVAVYVIMNDKGECVYRDHVYFDLTVPYVSSYLAFREIDPLQRLVEKQLKDRPDVTPRVILVDGNGRLHARRAGIACFLGVRTGIPTIGVGKKLYCEGNLTRENVDRGIDKCLVDIENAVQSSGDWTRSWNGPAVIIDQTPVDTTVTESPPPPEGRESTLDLIASFCRGVAVKLLGQDEETLACALLGHGGKIGKKGRNNKRGTKNPIFVSVGHGISLEEAVRLCSLLSFARIPEPVRQADLWGRDLLRTKQHKR